MTFDRVIKDGQEFIDIDGTMMPVYQLDLKKGTLTRSGCVNCDWHSMSEEEQEFIAVEIRNAMEQMGTED